VDIAGRLLKYMVDLDMGWGKKSPCLFLIPRKSNFTPQKFIFIKLGTHLSKFFSGVKRETPGEKEIWWWEKKSS
jgi:hypothetical protein